jgi:hypothetical protein
MHPEVLGKCENLQFPGPGQRETPVAKTKEDAYYILGLQFVLSSDSEIRPLVVIHPWAAQRGVSQ